MILRGKLELMMALSFGTPPLQPPPPPPKNLVLLQLANEKLSNQTSKILKPSK